jgi:AcrR family transcriptional regulator
MNTLNKDTRSNAKKLKILTKAIRLFKDNDTKKVTMDDIARLSNVSKMTVYKYYGDKESLYLYAAEALLERCDSDLKKHLNPHIDVVQKMIGFTSVLITFITEEDWSLCNRLGNLNEEVKNVLARFHESTKSLMLEIIKEGKKHHLMHENISDECIYHYINMGLNYFQNNMEYRNKVINNPVFRQEFMSFIWKNVFTDHSSFAV